MFHGDGTAPCFDCYRPAHVLIVGTKNQHFVFQSPRYTYIYIYMYIYIYICIYIMIHTKKMPFLTSSSSSQEVWAKFPAFTTCSRTARIWTASGGSSGPRWTTPCRRPHRPWRRYHGEPWRVAFHWWNGRLDGMGTMGFIWIYMDLSHFITWIYHFLWTKHGEILWKSMNSKAGTREGGEPWDHHILHDCKESP